MGGEGEVVLRFTVGSLLSHTTESFRRGTLHCFRITLVSKNFMHIMGSGYHDFPSKLCCLTQPKVFVGEPFRVPEYFWYRKTLSITREGYHGPPSKFSCLPVPTHSFEGTLLCFKESLLSKSLLLKRGRGFLPMSVETLLSHGTEKLLTGNLLCFRMFLVSEKFRIKGKGEGERVSHLSVGSVMSHCSEKLCGGSEDHDFRRKFVVSQYRCVS